MRHDRKFSRVPSSNYAVPSLLNTNDQDWRRRRSCNFSRCGTEDASSRQVGVFYR